MGRVRVACTVFFWALAGSGVLAPESRAVPPEVFTWRDIPRFGIVVTTGSISPPFYSWSTDLSTRSAAMRAVQRARPWARHARLRFLYHGPGPKVDDYAWPQIGLKLRAKDTCNLLYVMWHMHTSEVVVAVKRNPGLDTHEECKKRPDAGYTTLKQIPVPRDHRFGGWQTLEARTHHTSDRLLLWVFANGRQVFHELLYASQFGPFTGPEALDGPIGLRSDAGVFQFRLGREP